MMTNVWSPRGPAGSTSTFRTAAFRPDAPSFSPNATATSSFSPMAVTTTPTSSPPRNPSSLSPWDSEQVRATWGREESAVPGSGTSPTARAGRSRIFIIGDAWTGSADIFAPGLVGASVVSPVARPATSSYEDMALVAAGASASPGSSSSETPTARELAAVIMAGGGRVTPGHMMTREPPTPSPTEQLPFGNRCGDVRPATAAVIKLTSIEYGVTKAELIASIGESTPIVNMPPNSGSYAIHIMFDRQSAKSGDCYIEFPTDAAAAAIFNSRKNWIQDNAAHRRIGVRNAVITISSQKELMQELFPKAKCVTWHGQEPNITYPEDEYTSGFAGFLTSEELVMTAKWANEPQKSKYTGNHPQRPYESMITILFKFPWFATNTFTLGQRDLIHTTCIKMLRSLKDHIHRHVDPYRLNVELLNELLKACLECPGFSEKQRAQCIDAVQGAAIVRTHVTLLAPTWPFETISKKPTATEAHLKDYVELMKSALTDRIADFGDISTPWPVNKAGLTFNQAAHLEWRVVGEILKRVEGLKKLERQDSPHTPAMGLWGWN